MRRVRDLVRACPRHGTRRQALLLHTLQDQGLSQAPGRGSAAARRGAIDRGHRTRAGQRSRYCARMDRAQGKLRRIASGRDRIVRERRGGACTSLGNHDVDRCLAGTNPLAPDLMTAEERLTEVAQILAAGLLRLRRRQYLNASQRSGEEWPGLLARPKRSCDRTAAERGPAMSDTVLAQIAALKGQVDRRAARDVARAVRQGGTGPGQALPRGPASPTAFRSCTSAASPTGPGASSTPWPTSSSPKAARRRDPGRLLARHRSSGRQWQGTEHVVRVREHDFEYDGRPYRSLSAVARAIAGYEMERLDCSSAFVATARPDDRAAAQDPLRDLLPQELRGRVGPSIQFSLDAQREACLSYIREPAPRGLDRRRRPLRRRRLLRRYLGASGPAAAAPRHRGRQNRHGRLL